MWELRLGDELDDFCVKCRRLTNHLIVSLMDGKAAKVRCRSCYSDHDYRNEQAPPSKKELAKQKELFNSVLAGLAPAEVQVEIEAEVEAEVEAEPLLEMEMAAGVEIEGVIEPPAVPQPPARAKKKKS